MPVVYSFVQLELQQGSTSSIFMCSRINTGELGNAANVTHVLKCCNIIFIDIYNHNWLVARVAFVEHVRRAVATFHSAIYCLNARAPWNICSMFLTFVTFHWPMG